MPFIRTLAEVANTMADTDYTQALATVNNLHRQMAAMPRSVITALDDRKIDAFEGINLSFQGLQLANSVISLINTIKNDAEKRKLLYVLEHGVITLPDQA